MRRPPLRQMLGTTRTVAALGRIVVAGHGERRVRAIDALKALAGDSSLCATIAKLDGVVATVLEMTQRGDPLEADHALTLLKVPPVLRCRARKKLFSKFKNFHHNRMRRPPHSIQMKVD